MERSFGIIQIRLYRINQFPREFDFFEREEPVLFAVNRFEQQESVLRKTVSRAHEWILKDQWPEHRLCATYFCLQYDAHACFSNQNNVETVRRHVLGVVFA